MTELIVADGFDLQDLAAEMGASAEKTQGARLPRLTTNRRIKDDDGNRLELGHFYLTGQDETAYAESVKFRPLSHHFQYVKYNTEEKKMENWTVQASNFREEFRDVKGTIRCGRPDGKVMNKMTADQRKKYKDVKNVRLIRGLVSFVGKTPAGEEVTYDNVPCLVKLSGQNNFQVNDKGVYARFDKQVRDVIPRGYEMWNFELDVTSKEHFSDDGSVFWHTFEWSLDPKSPLAVDQKVYDSIVYIAENVRSENDAVNASYFDAIKRTVDVQGAMDAIGDDLEADFEDVA
jgi:hypothetical protein